MRRTLSCVFATFLFVILAASAPVRAQVSSKDADLEKLKQERDKAQIEADLQKAQADRAQAEATAFKATLGSLSTTNLPAGKVDLSNVVFEANYLAYMAARRTAVVIAGHICALTSRPKRITFLTQPTDLDNLRAFETLTQQIELIRHLFDKPDPLISTLSLDPADNPENISFPLKPAPNIPQFEKTPLYAINQALPATRSLAPYQLFSAIDAGLGILSLFKTDKSLTGVEIKNPDELALQLLVSQELKTCQISTIHPTYFFVPIRPFKADKSDPVPAGGGQQAPAGGAQQAAADEGLLNKLDSLAIQVRKTNHFAVRLEQDVHQPLLQRQDALTKKRDDLGTSLASKKKELTNCKTTQECQKLKGEADELKKRIDDIDKALKIYVTDLIIVEARLSDIKEVTKRATDLINALSKPDQFSIAPLQAMLRAERLKEALSVDRCEVPVLVTKFLSLGGNNITNKNIFTTSLSFSGGAVVDYALFSTEVPSATSPAADKNCAPPAGKTEAAEPAGNQPPAPPAPADNPYGRILLSGVVECYGGMISENDLKDATKKATKKDGKKSVLTKLGTEIPCLDSLEPSQEGRGKQPGKGKQAGKKK